MLKIQIEKLDANIDEVTIGRWLKAEGEEVAEGEPLVEIITDKVTFDLPCPDAGVLRRIAAAPKSVVPVGYTIALIGAADEPLPDVDAENQTLLDRLAAAREAEVIVAVHQKPEGKLRPLSRSDRVRATPAARRLAEQHGINLADLTPADGKAVTEKDVEAYLGRK
jgi:pyruvate/2-oxoglutarate dehydrogenase complex dihydrolipoamide acyltransferase (E2) component